MTSQVFNEEDIRQLDSKGMSAEDAIKQLEIFEKGFPFSRLARPCTVGDGIIVLGEQDLIRLESIYEKASIEGRTMKFIPASGAASRMFKLLISFNNNYEVIKLQDIEREMDLGDGDFTDLIKFIKEIKKFAFYCDLERKMSEQGLDLDSVIQMGDIQVILDFVLNQKGINLASLPKGLIAFHSYPGYFRTPFEEHLVEACEYTRDKNGDIRIHFTISPEHEKLFRDHLGTVIGRYEKPGIKFNITFSNQLPLTDTIAVDMSNNPFRTSNGRLLFRPGGHGALLRNLNDLNGDIVFIKNIDNVVPDRLKQMTYQYKKALGGLLVEIQENIFYYLKKISDGGLDDRSMNELKDFAETKLSITPPDSMKPGSRGDLTAFFFERLNRPFRVCGMVKNVGEPGGGPFWIEGKDGNVTPQIVESSQVDTDSPGQMAIWEASTHFNPVDLVCGVRDFKGKPFNLMEFTDPDTGFISRKSKEGRELKALELPGLWNGSMAYWNTVFVEVPEITFNPVKTVLDLLRKEHQGK